MSLETEAVLERRRQKRTASFWRGVALLAGLVAIFSLSLLRFGADVLSDRQQIARVTISGLITEDREQLKMLDRIAASNQVAGVILFVNSPGGTTTGGEALYEAIRKVARKKPVVAQFGTVAASAAFIAGLASDHIVARGNTITGSVGVIMQWPEFSEMLAKLGVKVNEIKSGPLKATPSMFQPADEAGRGIAQEMIDDGQQWFLALVRERRKIDTASVPGLEAGRIYSGRAALKHKLVDEIGGEATAIAWLTTKRNVPKGLKIVEWKPGSEIAFPFPGGWSLSSWIGQLFGLDRLNLIGENNGLRAIALDGLVSVWQPGKN
ncbi:MAG: hypothetical protein RLZ98_951 [Pseudomonadota bacterium]|jgi:protease-4